VVKILEAVKSAQKRVEVRLHITPENSQIVAQRFKPGTDNPVNVREHDLAMKPEQRAPQLVCHSKAEDPSETSAGQQPLTAVQVLGSQFSVLRGGWD
jgi:hypothetical protein